MTTALAELDALSKNLQDLRASRLRVAELSQRAREASLLQAALPPRYTEVLLGLLDRLESSALFAEESCSFSQTDLLDNLQLWLDKARAQVQH